MRRFSGMYRWYEEESGQKVEREVIERIFREFRGQPGLTCWFGELLSEGWEQFVQPKDRPVDIADFDKAYRDASNVLPNNNILNIISKARQEPYRKFVLELFQTEKKIEFKYDAAWYGKELGLKKISLIFFVERIDDENRSRLEADFLDPETDVKVEPIFVETGD